MLSRRHLVTIDYCGRPLDRRVRFVRPELISEVEFRSWDQRRADPTLILPWLREGPRVIGVA